MARKPELGDKLIFFGRVHEIYDFKTVQAEDANGETQDYDVVLAGELDIIRRRDDLKAQLVDLRAQQQNLTGDAHRAIHDQITELSKQHQEGAFKVRVRADQLEWIPSHSMWGSTGRILSDEQRRVLKSKDHLDSSFDAKNQGILLAGVEAYMAGDTYKERVAVEEEQAKAAAIAKAEAALAELKADPVEAAEPVAGKSKRG